MKNYSIFRLAIVTITVMAFLVIIVPVMLASGDMQMTGFNGLYVNGQGIGTATPAVIINSKGLPLVLKVNNTPVAEFDSNGADFANQSNFWRYQDVSAAPSIYAEAGVVSTTTSITTSILGIETPRNLAITWQTVTTATAGNITVTGVDARGESTTELVAVGAVSGTQSLVGVVPWASVTSLALPTRTEAVTLTIAGGQKFGLPIIPGSASDVYHLTVNATPQAAPTVNTTYGTFDPVSTPAANVDYNIWVK